MVCGQIIKGGVNTYNIFAFFNKPDLEAVAVQKIRALVLDPTFVSDEQHWVVIVTKLQELLADLNHNNSMTP